VSTYARQLARRPVSQWRPNLAVEPHIQLTSIDVIASALEPVIPTLGRVSSPDGAITLMLIGNRATGVPDHVRVA